MANRFFNPDQQFCDSTGLPYAGGSLAFYASGTSTPLNTYSDSALTIANTNPVVLDSAGRSGSIFLQNLAYKVVLSDINNVQVWTEDPVYASDYSTRAKLTSGAGSPNGNTAGTAGSAGIGADTYWDITNNILYVCTVTGNAATATWTAVNSTSAAAITPTPDGYLTPTSGTPIIPGDVIGATSLVYTPYTGNLVPIYTGTGFNPTTFSELTLTLTSSQAANTIYDVFIFNNSGVLTLVTGPAWTNSTAGSCARGTGAGTTQLSRLNGIWVNTVQITGRNGASSYTIPANQATYLGSIYTDGTAGQVSCHRTIGQNRKWGIWNAYNRVPILLQVQDPTAVWTYQVNTIRASNNVPASYSSAIFNVGGSTANGLNLFCGLAEEETNLSFNQYLAVTASSTTATSQIIIGINSITVASATTVVGQSSLNAPAISLTVAGNAVATYLAPPALGLNIYAALERTLTGAAAGAQNAYSGSTMMILAASYRG